MQILFKRNTHDEQGNYRGDEYFGKVDICKATQRHRENFGTFPTQTQLDDWHRHNSDMEKNELYFGPHTLKPRDGMTLEEVYKETWNALYGGALDGQFDPKDPRLTIEGHLKALAYMIEHKMVTATIRVS
jgi:hypothetical protein